MEIREPSTAKEAFEIIKIGVDKILPLMSSENVQYMLEEGNLEMIRKNIHTAQDTLAAKKAEIERIKLEGQIEKEKAKGEVGAIYDRANNVLHEAVRLLESVKPFVGEIERKRYSEFMKKATKEAVTVNG